VTPEFFRHPTVDCAQNVSLIFTETGTSKYRRLPLFYDISYNATINGSAPTYISRSADIWNERDTCPIANDLLRSATGGTLQRLSNEECINAYGPGNAKMKHRSNLLVVTKAQALNPNVTILMDFRYEKFVTNYTANNWVCSPAHLNSNNYECDWKKLAKTANASWNLGWIDDSGDTKRLRVGEEYPIDYCLSQTTE